MIRMCDLLVLVVFFFQAEDGIRDYKVTGVQTCALPIFQPGTLVAIQNGQAVTYQNGVYVPADPRRVPYEVSGRVTLIDSVENVLVLDEIGRASCRERV